VQSDPFLSQPATTQEYQVEISRLLLIALIVVVGFWLVNRMYYSNQKYDLDYRRKRYAKKDASTTAHDGSARRRPGLADGRPQAFCQVHDRGDAQRAEHRRVDSEHHAQHRPADPGAEGIAVAQTEQHGHRLGRPDHPLNDLPRSASWLRHGLPSPGS
jgi:ABC-type nickel/cobalt efflux system permease component RcnA